MAQTKSGSVGVQVSILHPDAKIHDKIDLSVRKNIVEDEKDE